MYKFKIFSALSIVMAVGMSLPVYSQCGSLNADIVPQSQEQYWDLQKNSPYFFEPIKPEVITPIEMFRSKTKREKDHDGSHQAILSFLVITRIAVADD